MTVLHYRVAVVSESIRPTKSKIITKWSFVKKKICKLKYDENIVGWMSSQRIGINSRGDKIRASNITWLHVFVKNSSYDIL